MHIIFESRDAHASALREPTLQRQQKPARGRSARLALDT